MDSTNPYGCPLPQEMFDEILADTGEKSFGNEPGSGIEQTLEDKISHTLTDLGEKVYPTTYFKSMTLDEAYQLNKFHTVVLLRYIQRETGRPEMVQMLCDYGCANGNQVDIYLDQLLYPNVIPLIKCD